MHSALKKGTEGAPFLLAAAAVVATVIVAAAVTVAVAAAAEQQKQNNDPPAAVVTVPAKNTITHNVTSNLVSSDFAAHSMVFPAAKSVQTKGRVCDPP